MIVRLRAVEVFYSTIPSLAASAFFLFSAEAAANQAKPQARNPRLHNKRLARLTLIQLTAICLPFA
ncbi:hypothetical protein CC78DRAFT_536663 [Lojkania enalia]|uniref:Uncharacterized protein n=1 Tax=Lojkania enalia TaxID=147567 RepID=A0A9P4K2E1_9PLEO|nr:hypothetical protein CC78DRAFT_536663 [Didymosphaeria enalia]